MSGSSGHRGLGLIKQNKASREAPPVPSVSPTPQLGWLLNAGAFLQVTALKKHFRGPPV